MNYFTANTYEMKRELINFSKKMSSGLGKSKSKFLMDTIYGIAKSGSVLTTEIARALHEKVQLKNTVERLDNNLSIFTLENRNIVKENYIQEIKNCFPNEPTIIGDNSDIAKPYGRKFEDLDRVKDASSLTKEAVNGYHVCEAVILTARENQPISVYSKIFSCKSKGYKSMFEYLKESILEAKKFVPKKKCNIVLDRGYDDVKVIKFIDEIEDNFVIRMNDDRNFLCKGKKKNGHEMAIRRKGKIKMTLWFDDKEEHEVSISHTKVVLPANKKEYELVFVYGLDEEHPMMLLTNREIHSKEDVIKVVRLYFSRWRIEEYFRAKKQEYDFENMRVRTLESMNNLNFVLSIYLGLLGKLAEEIDYKLLTIKIIERSRSLRNKIVMWLSQIAKGVKEILYCAHDGIKEWQKIEKRPKYKQLSLDL